MNDKILERFGGARKAEAVAPAPAETMGDSDNLGCFGILRGTAERSIMIELRQKTGNIMAVGYSWLERIEFDPSVGIKLIAAGMEILITGRNLNEEIRTNVRLFECLARHRVPWLREADEDELMRSLPAATVIEKISWKGFKR